MRAVNRSKRSQDLTLEKKRNHTLGKGKSSTQKCLTCQGICFVSRRVADSLRDPSIWSLEASFSFCWLRREVPSFFFASQKIQGNKNQSEELIFVFLSRSSFWMLCHLDCDSRSLEILRFAKFEADLCWPNRSSTAGILQLGPCICLSSIGRQKKSPISQSQSSRSLLV